MIVGKQETIIRQWTDNEQTIHGRLRDNNRHWLELPLHPTSIWKSEERCSFGRAALPSTPAKPRTRPLCFLSSQGRLLPFFMQKGFVFAVFAPFFAFCILAFALFCAHLRLLRCIALLHASDHVENYWEFYCRPFRPNSAKRQQKLGSSWKRVLQVVRPSLWTEVKSETLGFKTKIRPSFILQLPCRAHKVPSHILPSTFRSPSVSKPNEDER